MIVHRLKTLKTWVIKWKHTKIYQLTNWLHGVEPFLISRQLWSYSGTSQHFMKPEDSLPCSQEPSTGPYPQPDVPPKRRLSPDYMALYSRRQNFSPGIQFCNLRSCFNIKIFDTGSECYFEQKGTDMKSVNLVVPPFLRVAKWFERRHV
jgi:hypothetical protein